MQNRVESGTTVKQNALQVSNEFLFCSLVNYHVINVFYAFHVFLGARKSYNSCCFEFNSKIVFVFFGFLHL